jgi:hypothetical protein
VTIMAPAHIADFIEQARGPLEGILEDWMTATIEQCLARRTYKECEAEFDDLYIEAAFEFDGPADKKKFMAPIRVALKKAHAAHHAMNAEGVA